MSFTFNWHEEERDSFLQYVWITLMQDLDFQELMGLTDGGKKITLQVIANGKEVNARNFFDGLTANFDISVNNKAAELAREAGLSELEAKIYKIQKEITKTLEAKLEAIGVKIPKDEW